MLETFRVPEMSCGHCKATVEGALNQLDGVERAEAHVEDKRVEVAFDPDRIDRQRLVEAIENSGYPVAV